MHIWNKIASFATLMTNVSYYWKHPHNYYSISSLDQKIYFKWDHQTNVISLCTHNNGLSSIHFFYAIYQAKSKIWFSINKSNICNITSKLTKIISLFNIHICSKEVNKWRIFYIWNKVIKTWNIILREATISF